MQQASVPGFDPPAKELHNLFFALLPDDTTRTGIVVVADRLQHDHPQAGRWLKPSRYHMTLQFIGEHAALSPALVAAACATAAGVEARTFELTLDTIGSFANARVGWLGCKRMPQPLANLFDQLGAALRANGVPVLGSARLAPHVSLVRDARQVFEQPLSPALAWHVDELVLIDSQTKPFRPHRILGRWKLR